MRSKTRNPKLKKSVKSANPMIKTRLIGPVRVFLFLGFLMVCTHSWSMERSEAEGLFRKAVIAYNDDAFDDAISLNSRILDAGFESEAVYYNLGNAWFKKGRPGKAVLYYLRAESLAPRDADLRANLDFARKSVVNYAPFERDKKLARFFPFKHFSGEELKWIAFMFFVITGGLFLALVYGGEKRKRLVMVGAVCAGMFFYFLAAALVNVSVWSGYGVCLDATEAKFEPSEKGTTYFQLPEGTEVHILREKDHWLKIKRPDGKTGWVPADKAEEV